ncbi:MAG: hypothetical protein IT364_12560 [Candidatus Hydrogenedentes bacterium]|nr:hypothetical protein [Candidatus Hydrogenedentota bacterium]
MLRHLGSKRVLMGLTLALASFGLAWADDLQKPEPGKRIRVFLFAGQSNMEGRADGRELTEADRVQLKQAQNQIQLAYNHESLRPLDVVKPSDEIREIYRRDQIFGPELFFGIALAEAWPGERMLFIKQTVGGTSLHGCWNPDWSRAKAAVMGEENGPRLYGELVAYVKQVLSAYAPDEYEICAMLWVQGESDRKVEEAAAAYGANLSNLVGRIRQDTGDEALPFILFQVGSGKVIEGMRQVAGTVENVTLIPQDSDPSSGDYYATMENGHYNYQGMKKLGSKFAEVFLTEYAQKQK